MQFQMRQSVSYAVICGKGCSPSFKGEWLFLIYGKLRKIARVSKSFVFFANYGGSEGGLSPLLIYCEKMSACAGFLRKGRQVRREVCRLSA